MEQTGVLGVLWYAAAIAFVMWCASAEARPSSAVDGTSDKLQAFDMKSIGPQGITFDSNSAPKTYGLEMSIIELNNVEIREYEKRIDTRKGPDGPLNDAQIAALKLAIESVKKKNLQLELELQGDDPCDGQAAGEWHHLIDFAHQAIQNENDQKLKSTSDFGNYFQNAIDEFESWILVGEGALKRIDQECKRWKAQMPEPPPKIPATAPQSPTMEDVGRDAHVREAAKKAIEEAQRSAQEAQSLAAKGQIMDVPEIASKVSVVVGTARSLEKWGFGEEGLAQWQAADQVLETFAEQYVAKCSDQPVVIGWILNINRQLQMTGSKSDLTPCMYRLWAAGLQAPGIKLEFRACIIFPAGSWQGRKKYDREDISGTADIDPSGVGNIHLMGTNSVADSYPFMEVIDGTAKIVPVTRINQLGFTQRWATMTLQATTAAHPIRQLNGKILQMPALSWTEELKVMILNENKPCDPNKDVWSYH